MRTPPLLADFTHPRACKPICEKSLTLPSCGVTIEKYLEYFGYKNPKSVGEKEYFVETIGFLLPAVEIKKT